MNLKEMLQESKFHKDLAAAYLACGQEALAKIEADKAAKWLRKSYRLQASRA